MKDKVEKPLVPGWVETHRRTKKQIDEWYKSKIVINNSTPHVVPPVPEKINRQVKAVKVDDVQALASYRRKTRNYRLKSPAGEPKRFEKTSNWRALTDSECVQARIEHQEFTINELSARYNVSPHTMKRAIKGLSYKHLNKIAKPWK